MPTETSAALPSPSARIPSNKLAKGIISQAFPILIGQWATIAYGVIDTILVGHSSPGDLAVMALGASIYGSIFVGMLGFLGALNPIIAQHFGAQRHDEVGKTVMQGMWLALWLTILGDIGLAFPGFWLSMSKVDAGVHDGVAHYLLALAFALPAALLFRTTYALNTAISRPRIIMIINLIGLGIKIPLSYVLVYGEFGLPKMGAVGCGIASACVMWLLCLLAAATIYFDSFYRRFKIRFAWPQWTRQKELLHLGIPMGLSYFVEVTGFTFMALLAARLGTNTVGAHQIIANLGAACYMAPMTMSVAIATLTAQSIGAGDLRTARRIALLGLRLAFGIALVLILMIWLLRKPIIHIYTSDPAVALIALSLVPYLVGFHVFDALQTVSSFVLRAYKQAVAPMLVYTFALWGIGLGGGYWIAFHPVFGQPLGIDGLWIAASVSLMVAAGALIAYMLYVSNKIDITPKA